MSRFPPLPTIFTHIGTDLICVSIASKRKRQSVRTLCVRRFTERGVLGRHATTIRWERVHGYEASSHVFFEVLRKLQHAFSMHFWFFLIASRLEGKSPKTVAESVGMHCAQSRLRDF